MEATTIEDLLLEWLANQEERRAWAERWRQVDHGIDAPAEDESPEARAERAASDAEWSPIHVRYCDVESRLTAAAVDLRAARAKGAA